MLREPSLEWFEDEAAFNSGTKGPKGRMELAVAILERKPPGGASLELRRGEERLVMQGDDLDGWEQAIGKALRNRSAVTVVAKPKKKKSAVVVQAPAGDAARRESVDGRPKGLAMKRKSIMMNTSEG